MLQNSKTVGKIFEMKWGKKCTLEDLKIHFTALHPTV
jgi:hypothetical protein